MTVYYRRMHHHSMTSSTKRKGGRRLRVGLVLGGRYQIEELIAEGGMGSVYRARDLQLGTVVAVKSLYETYKDNEIVRARFVDEGRIQMMLDHPNILRVYALIESPVLAFVMEYVEGGTLEDMLVEQGVLSTGQVLSCMLPILSALGLAHSQGIIHRDLKPSNILMQRVGGAATRPKVMDFGVAKLNRAQSLTATGTTVGTLHYMSPEQIVGSKKIDGRADIYSLGISLYKLCTGEVPFNASTEFALMMAQVESPPRPPSQLNPKLDPRLEQIILRALQKKPNQRYQSIKEFTQALMLLAPSVKQAEPTITELLPEEVLRYALMADEVAEDKTRELVLEAFGEATTLVADDRTVEERLPLSFLAGSSEADESTMEVARLRLDELQRADKRVQMTPDEEGSTVPVSRLDVMRTLERPRPQVSPGVTPALDTEEQTAPVRRDAGRARTRGADSHDATRPKLSALGATSGPQASLMRASPPQASPHQGGPKRGFGPPSPQPQPPQLTHGPAPRATLRDVPAIQPRSPSEESGALSRKRAWLPAPLAEAPLAWVVLGALTIIAMVLAAIIVAMRM